MSVPKVKHVRASVVRGGGGNSHDVEDGHWIDDHVSTPMARYPADLDAFAEVHTSMATEPEA